MTQVMVAFEKHAVRYLDMSKGIGPTAKALLEERVDAGYWYTESETMKARIALSGDDPRFSPWHFLSRRKDYEYESVEIVTLEEIAP